MRFRVLLLLCCLSIFLVLSGCKEAFNDVVYDSSSKKNTDTDEKINYAHIAFNADVDIDLMNLTASDLDDKIFTIVKDPERYSNLLVAISGIADSEYNEKEDITHYYIRVKSEDDLYMRRLGYYLYSGNYPLDGQEVALLGDFLPFDVLTDVGIKVYYKIHAQDIHVKYSE